MTDLKRYNEANKIATEKTTNFVQNVNHGQSHGEILKQYENEIHRLNRELLLTSMEAASTMKIKTDKCDHPRLKKIYIAEGGEYIYKCVSCDKTVND